MPSVLLLRTLIPLFVFPFYSLFIPVLSGRGISSPASSFRLGGNFSGRTFFLTFPPAPCYNKPDLIGKERRPRKGGNFLKTLRIIFTVISAIFVTSVIPVGAIYSWLAAGVCAVGAFLFFGLMLLCKQKQEEIEAAQQNKETDETSCGVPDSASAGFSGSSGTPGSAPSGSAAKNGVPEIPSSKDAGTRTDGRPDDRKD